jgi:antitoxin (DNA-binding transcriptional repressor) of toxin-antitoxin stability system
MVAGTETGYNTRMTTVTVEDVQRDLLGHLRKVEAGETLIITQADRPVAELRPVEAGHKELRPYGLCAGEFTVPDDFDAPLPEVVLRQFEG